MSGVWLVTIASGMHGMSVKWERCGLGSLIPRLSPLVYNHACTQQFQRMTFELARTLKIGERAWSIISRE